MGRLVPHGCILSPVFVIKVYRNADMGGCLRIRNVIEGGLGGPKKVGIAIANACGMISGASVLDGRLTPSRGLTPLSNTQHRIGRKLKLRNEIHVYTHTDKRR